VEALLDAIANGKRVFAFVELKARFDEHHNVSWARALERAGAHVVYGIVGLKTHAKMTLIVRRESGHLKRYVHVSTGNYNVRSGEQYTDLSLFSAREELSADIADLFNQLMGASKAPDGLRRGALVAPAQLLQALLELIAEQAAAARRGDAASITLKVNGLSDPDIVAALYEASEAGVSIDLVVRGICTLRPAIPGRSSRIRVVSVVGRFLEHSRIYRFGNERRYRYFIGSSDLRPRNLRRRVELLVPVEDASHQSKLDNILERYVHHPDAWLLGSDGEYSRQS
jgi:polyphosphate kinase